MDIYHIWVDLKDGVRDSDFAADLHRFMAHMKAQGLIAGYRLTRRKLGLGPSDLGEFHVMVEFTGLGQLDNAFAAAATRADPLEQVHHAVNAKVKNFRAALYRDFPDPHRVSGQERF